MINITIAMRYLFGKFTLKNIFQNAALSIGSTGKNCVKKDNDVKFSSFFPIFALILSISVLVVSVSINTGFKVEIIKRILGFNGHLVVHNNGQNIQNAINIVGKTLSQEIKNDTSDICNVLSKEISNLQYNYSKSYNVLSVYGIVKQQVIISGQDASGAILQGVTLKDIQNRPLIKDSIAPEVMSKFINDPDAIIIGNKLAAFLGIQPGDMVMVLCPQTKKLSLSNITPKVKYMKFVGTFDVGMSEYNSAFAFVHLTTAQSMFSMGNSINEIDIFIEDPNESELVKNAMRGVLSNLNLTYEVLDWKDVNDTFLSAINMQKLVMLIFFCLVIIIATFSTIGSITGMIQRKSREIAILRTIGFSQKRIVMVFLIVAEVIAGIGIFLGIIIGVLISKNLTKILYFIEKITGIVIFDANAFVVSELPCIIQISDLLYIAVLAFLITFIASFYPAIKAARLDPVNVLRHE